MNSIRKKQFEKIKRNKQKTFQIRVFKSKHGKNVDKKKKKTSEITNKNANNKWNSCKNVVIYKKNYNYNYKKPIQNKSIKHFLIKKFHNP